MLSPKEEAYVAAVRTRLVEMRDFLVEHDIESCRADVLFVHLSRLARISGNLSMGRAFGACLLAKSYLMKRFQIEELDVAEKAQGASGPDIDAKTADGKRVLAEIKTTVPHELARRDFGANQRISLRKDWKKLREGKAHHKFFFLTDRDAFAIVNARYRAELPKIEIVLLGR